MGVEFEHSQFAEVLSNIRDVHTGSIQAGSKMSRRNIRVRVGMSLLRAFFRQFIHKGTLIVISPDGRFEHVGHGAPSVAIRITNSSVIPWLLTNPRLWPSVKRTWMARSSSRGRYL